MHGYAIVCNGFKSYSPLTLTGHSAEIASWSLFYFVAYQRLLLFHKQAPLYQALTALSKFIHLAAITRSRAGST